MKLDGLIAQSIEHCTGIAVRGSNLVQAASEFFSGFNFTTGQVVCMTAVINHKFISFSAVQYMIFHIFIYKLIKLRVITS